MSINPENPCELICNLDPSGKPNGEDVIEEYKITLGNPLAVLRFFEGLGLAPIRKTAFKHLNHSFQIQYHYDYNIVAYDAPSPHLLPSSIKRNFDEFYQRDRFYIQSESPIFKDEGIKLMIPDPSEFHPVMEPYARGLPDKLIASVEPIPTLIDRLSTWITDPDCKVSSLLPAVNFSKASEGLLAINFDSEEQTRLALIMIGQGRLSLEEQKNISPRVKKSLFVKDNVFHIPIINPNNSKQLLVPVTQPNKSGDCQALLGDNTVLTKLYRLLDPSFSDEQKSTTVLRDFLDPDFKTKSLTIKAKTEILKDSSKQLKVYLPGNSRLLKADKNKEIIQRYFEVANKMKLSTKTRAILEYQLLFAEENGISLEEEAKKTQIVIPAHVKTFLIKFLNYKKTTTRSTNQEDIYKNMTLDQFIARLVEARPAVFWLRQNEYVLWDGQTAYGWSNYKKINPRIALQEDELPVAALLISSSPTHFFNKGDLWDLKLTKRGKLGTYQEKGNVMSLVGTRLEKAGESEYRHVIITKEQNQLSEGYGAKALDSNPKKTLNTLWAEFYGLSQPNLPSYDEVKVEIKASQERKSSQRYLDIGEDEYFNLELYLKRTYLLIEAYLKEADAKAAEAKTTAYVDAMSFGTGVWAPHQTKNIQETVIPMLYHLALQHNHFKNISDIHFSHLDNNQIQQCGPAKNGETLSVNDNHVKIQFSNRSPNKILPLEHSHKLLIRLYQGDSNSWGNEFWKGNFRTGEPAAFVSSLISFYQVPKLNPALAADLAEGKRIHYHGSDPLPSMDSVLNAQNWQSFVKLDTPIASSKKQSIFNNSPQGVTASSASPEVTASGRPF